MSERAINLQESAKRPWRFVRLTGFAAVGLVLTVLVGGMVFQRIGEMRAASLYPAPGEFYDVGDVSLHMVCRGKGDQTVLLSSGMGNPASSWRPLERLLTPDFRVCSYDRDGLGWSDDSGAPRDAGVASDRLARLLDAASITGPVILIGHSYGGVVARVFAKDHPSRVSVLVLLDSSHEDMGERFPPFAQEGFRDLLNGFQLAPWLNMIGVPRAFDLFAPAIDGLEGADYEQSLALLNSISHMRGTAEEARGWERSAVAGRKVAEEGLGELPLDVFVAGAWPDEMLPSWTEMQSELSALSTNGRFYLVAEANHPQIGMSDQFVPLVVEVVRRRAAALDPEAQQ
ncbi:alpha/beta hydrolase [Parvibaculaceae bacterium PLY_AMNH_Bact1]|nr:alpha/beta hydrolase [Parvibaculaceae bacterium PLY_AMNH_Bact1]